MCFSLLSKILAGITVETCGVFNLLHQKVGPRELTTDLMYEFWLPFN